MRWWILNRWTTREVPILLLDYISILVVILYHNLVRFYHWWKLDKVHMDIPWDHSILFMTMHKTI